LLNMSVFYARTATPGEVSPCAQSAPWKQEGAKVGVMLRKSG
jgi:hypothetical protein